MLVSEFTFHWYTSKFLNAMKGILGAALIFYTPVLFINLIENSQDRVIESPLVLIIIYVLISASIGATLFYFPYKYPLSSHFIGTATYTNGIISIADTSKSRDITYRFDEVRSIYGNMVGASEGKSNQFLKLIIEDHSGSKYKHFIYIPPYDILSHGTPSNEITTQFANLRDDWSDYQESKKG